VIELKNMSGDTDVMPVQHANYAKEGGKSIKIV